MKTEAQVDGTAAAAGSGTSVIHAARAERAVACLALLLAGGRVAAAGNAERLTAEEVVARHLGSIGTAEARAAASPLRVEGDCRLEIRRGGAGHLIGRSTLVSEGRQLRIDLPFGDAKYRGESLVFDGRKVEVAFIVPSQRSGLGDFLNTYDVVLREGLLAGVLTTAWPLHDLAGRKAKLKYDGLKVLDGPEVHQLTYKAAKGQGDVRITLHFDRETFRHVHTAYRLQLRPGLSGDMENSAGQVDTEFRVEETFGDFGTAGGLTLPRRWTVSFSREGQSSSSLWSWESELKAQETGR